MVYAGESGLLSEIRLAIAIEVDIFRKFADKLRAIVLELEFEYRNISPKL
jgi:hypothetical protein